MKKMEYIAPEVCCRQIKTTQSYLLTASFDGDGMIYQSTSAPVVDIDFNGDPLLKTDGGLEGHYDAWGDAKKNFSSDWD